MAGSIQAIKTYHVVNAGTFTTRNVELHHANMPFLWAQQDTWKMGVPKIRFRTQSPTGPVIAGAKLPVFARGVDVVLGDPEDKSLTWTAVEPDNSFTLSSYSFRGYGSGHLYTWKRTHNHAFGSSRLSGSDFKLVDPSNGDKVLAVYIKDSFMGGPNLGHIDYFVELGQDLELQTIASILGIEERLRRRRRGNAAAGGGGGAAAAC